MRLLLVLLAAALAASVSATAGASPSRTPVVNHWIKVEFGVGIDVEWSRDGGARSEPCSTWSHEEGTYEVSAGSLGELPPGKQAGAFIHPPPRRGVAKIPTWALLYAPGRAKVTMKRTVRQEGQTNACGSAPAKPTKFPPNDCGQRTYVSRSALVRPDYRDSLITLEELLAAPEKRFYPAISIDAAAQQFLYQRCDVPTASFPTGVHNVGIPVAPTTVARLRSMRIGQTVRIRVRVPAGSACAQPQVPNETCTYELDVHVDIKRVKAPSGR